MLTFQNMRLFAHLRHLNLISNPWSLYSTLNLANRKNFRKVHSVLSNVRNRGRTPNVLERLSMVALNKEWSVCLIQSNSRTFALVVAYTALWFSFSELITILFSSWIVHSFYRKDPLEVSNFSFKFASTFGMTIQCLVNDKMENYNQFFFIWLKVLATVFLNKLECWSGSKDKTER